MSEPAHKCPLCGFAFDPTGLACHTSCPMSKGCNLICCPNCGYQIPDENRMGLSGALKRALEDRKAKREETRA